jgi:hypothetical protein
MGSGILVTLTSISTLETAKSLEFVISDGLSAETIEGLKAGIRYSIELEDSLFKLPTDIPPANSEVKKELEGVYTFNGVVFDDTTMDEVGNKWSQICEACYKKYTVKFKKANLDIGLGSGICGVAGCSTESDHYIDFPNKLTHKQKGK